MVSNPLHSIESNFQTPLSRKDMFEISNDISRDYSPVQPVEQRSPSKSTTLSKQDLLEVSQNISLYYGPTITSTVNKLVILPVDPKHIYAYWSLVDKKDFTLSKNILHKELVLRVYSERIGEEETVNHKPVVELPVQELQSSQRISLPTSQRARVVSAAIGQNVKKNSFLPVINSSHTYTFQGSHMSLIEKNEVTSADCSTTDYNGNVLIETDLQENPDSINTYYAQTNKSGKGKKKQQQ